jgi:peroxiredoxin
MKCFKNISAFLIMLCAVSSCIHEDPVSDEIKVGDAIPDFTVEMTDGSIVTGASLREGVSLIMFFYSQCPDCQKTLPAVQKIYDEYKSKGMKFALISRSQLDDPISEYWKAQGYTMPYSAQPTREIYALFASSRVPRVYICQDGVVKSFYRDDPIPTYEQLKADVEKLF